MTSTKMIQEYSGQKECNLKPYNTDEFPLPVKRPAFSVIDKSLIKKIFGVDVPYRTDSLNKFISNIIN